MYLCIYFIVKYLCIYFILDQKFELNLDGKKEFSLSEDYGGSKVLRCSLQLIM
jgi:hypothetical protein